MRWWVAHATRRGELRVAGGALSICLVRRITWPCEWSMAPLSSKRDWNWWGRGRAKRRPECRRNTFTGVGEVATWVSGTGFWVKALPVVMTSFSRASFDWAVHFPQWMHTARPPPTRQMSLQIIHGWQTINPAKFSPMPLQGDSGGALTERWEE